MYERNKQIISAIIFFNFLETEFYNKAVEVAPNVSDEFKQELSERRCWSLNHLRSYFRAVHGQANTLRKMGRYEESLKKYLELEKLDPDFYRYMQILSLLTVPTNLIKSEIGTTPLPLTPVPRPQH